ncbi:MAG: hypothetical protein ACK4MX_08415 [Thermaurantiacus sp.]
MRSDHLPRVDAAAAIRFGMPRDEEHGSVLAVRERRHARGKLFEQRVELDLQRLGDREFSLDPDDTVAALVGSAAA